MKSKILYQTLEDRGNIESIQENAPFICTWGNTWLGDGYYFWESFIENAHWWGEVHYKGNYIICKAKCNFNTRLCFDLVGETEHMKIFRDCIQYLKEKNMINQDTTVARILSFLRNKIPEFNYQAVRVHGARTISENKEKYNRYRHHMKFEVNRTQYLDLTPAIQICIFEKNGLNLRDLSICFPKEYCPNYMV